jgi:glycosyltransferase involved in cell wall biosynthesis
MPTIMAQRTGMFDAAPTHPGPQVLHVVPTALGRGAQVFARALVDQLGGASGGHTLVSLFDGDTGIQVDRALGLPGGVAAASGLHPPALVRLIRILRELRPDLVLAHGGDAFKYLALATRAPIAYCVIGTWPAATRRSPQSLGWRALMRRAWVSAAVSDDVAADLHDVLAVPEGRIIVIPNGRDAERYKPPADSRQGEDVSLLFVGAFTEGKRPDRFIQLVQRLRQKGLPVRATMVGDGPLRPSLESQGKAADIEFAGFRDDVVPYLQKADLFVFPSAPDGEGMPGVLIEAGLCGLPVVATRVAGASTVLEDGLTGILVAIDDPDALARAVSGLVQDRERRLAMGSTARDRCVARFALPVVADRWDALFAVMASAHDMQLPRAAALEPMRVA